MKAASEFHVIDAARTLLSAGRALSGHALLHGQLAQIEWEEEKDRLLKMLMTTLLGFACLLCVLLFAGALLVATSWETPYRIPVAAGLVLIYGAGVALAWHRLQALAALRHQAFAASRQELAADAALLKAAL